MPGGSSGLEMLARIIQHILGNASRIAFLQIVVQTAQIQNHPSEPISWVQYENSLSECMKSTCMLQQSLQELAV